MSVSSLCRGGMREPLSAILPQGTTTMQLGLLKGVGAEEPSDGDHFEEPY